MWFMLKNKFRFIMIPLAACLFLTACGNEEATQAQYKEALMAPESANYDTVSVESGDYIVTSQGSVSIDFPTEIDLCWETEGTTMKELLVEKGQEVQAGDVLMTFEIASDKIALEELEIKLLRMREDYARKKDVLEIEIAEAEEEAEEIEDGHSYRIAVLNIEKQRISYEQYVYETEKSIVELQEQITEYKETIANNQLVAPIDGVISSVVYYSAGDDIEVGEKLISMYATDTFILKVSNADDKLRYNMEVSVKNTNQANAQTYIGRVVSAPNILPSGVNQDYAIIELEEGLKLEDYGFRAGPGGRGFGFSVSIEFTANLQELHSVLLTDKSALQKEDGKYFVYILEDGAIHKRFVSVGLSSKNSAWIIDGLSDGQELILD